jgi:glc operon protein GlcG
MRPIKTLTHAEAERAVVAVKKELEKRGKAAVVAVADEHGELIALLRIDGARLPAIEIAKNKAYTAARERRHTKDIGDAVRDPKEGFDISYYGDPRILGWAGGVPVRTEGEVVGAVAVSGLTGAEDTELAELGVRAILG